MMRVLLFGGTTEGRELAGWLAGRDCDVVAYSATEYGASRIEAGPHVESRVGPLPAGAMERLMRRGGFACVVDATHPYAVDITEHVARAAGEAGLPRLRLVREDVPEGDWDLAPDAAGAARMLASRVRAGGGADPGRVLLTTGSKELAVFTEALDDFAERLYVRVLPVVSSVEHATRLGIPTSHIVAMQGPFSQQLNVALIRELRIGCLVTKASGRAGGFWEKVGAARACGIGCIVIDRPVHEEGVSLDEAKRQLEENYGI